jgi:hypothetical protein
LLTVRHPTTWAPERAYVLDVVLRERLGVPYEAIAEERDDTAIGDVVLPDGLFAAREEDWLTERARPAGDDPLGTVFFHLTRYEELAGAARDAHDRVPGAPCERPVADEAVEQLRTLLEQAHPRLELRRGEFETVPSHDVDVPRCTRRSVRTAALDVVKRRDPRLALTRLSASGDPCDTFDYLLEQSERRGLTSTFFFMAGVTSPERDGNYSLDAPYIRRLLRAVHARGHELGLHPSYGTFRSATTIASELATLRSACDDEGIEQERWGARQHYLRWENPTTWRAYEEAGLAYDASLHFPSHPGFRAGTCFDYPVFDLVERRPLALREQPLVAMEASFLQYARLSHDDAYDRMVELKHRCREVGGRFTLLWHNNRLETTRDRRLYEAVLDA